MMFRWIKNWWWNFTGNDFEIRKQLAKDFGKAWNDIDKGEG